MQQVWLLVAVEGLALGLDGEATEQAFDAQLIRASAEPEMLDGDEEGLTELNREVKHYAAFVMSTIAGEKLGVYDVPRIECAKKCDALDMCEGFVTDGEACQLMKSRNVVTGRSDVAEHDRKAEFAYVKRKAMPMPHAHMAGFTKGWQGVFDKSGALTLATRTNPWTSTSLPCSLDFDLKYSAMLTSISIDNAVDPVHHTGADRIEVYAKGDPSEEHSGGWIRVMQSRIRLGESVTLPVEACHTRFVRVKFLTFHGDPGAVNVTKVSLNGGIGINPLNLNHHDLAKKRREAMEADARKYADMGDCPLINKYSHPTLPQLSTWAVHQPQCMCGEVINEQATGNTDYMVQDQINRWAANMKSGEQFASENFGHLWNQDDAMSPATVHYGKLNESWAGLNLNASDWEAFKSARKSGALPPLKWYLFKPVATRGQSRGIQIGDLHFWYKGKEVETTGIRVKALAGSVAKGSEPDMLFDNDPETTYSNTVADAGIAIEFPHQEVIDAITLTTGPSKPKSDPIMWQFFGGYDGNEWPFMLSDQEVEGPVPRERKTESDPIKLFPTLIPKPEPEPAPVKEEDALAKVASWAKIKYQLQEGEERLGVEQVTAECLAMSCLSYQITRAKASQKKGCIAHLVSVCEKYAEQTGCPAQCDGTKESSCVVIRKRTTQLTDHWLANAVEPIERKPAGNTSLSEKHLRLVEVNAQGQAIEVNAH